MVKYGIISDTHVEETWDQKKINNFIDVLRRYLSKVDEIIHTGDVISESFLNRLKEIAPVHCVMGDSDKIMDLPKEKLIEVEGQRIGIIHNVPINELDQYIESRELNILIMGHTHIPSIKGLESKCMILNPGSIAYPIAPPKKPGFEEPVAKPTLIILNIENGLASAYLISLPFKKKIHKNIKSI
jgi:putative phosphoesterase